MKKDAHTGGACRTLGQFVPKCCLYKGVRVIEIVIVEDVLVLVCERLVRHGRLVHLTSLSKLKCMLLIKGPAWQREK